MFRQLLRSALDLVRGCPCRGSHRGCPGCVQCLDCRMYNAVLWKDGAAIVLQAALEQEEGEQGAEGGGDD